VEVFVLTDETKHTEIEETKYNVIDIDPKRAQKINNLFSKLYVENEVIDFQNFIISGYNKNEERVVLTWSCQVDDLCAHSKLLEIVVNDKIRGALNLSSGNKAEELLKYKELLDQGYITKTEFNLAKNKFFNALA
jgi:hypothetical protein